MQVINTNVMSLNAQRNLSSNNQALAVSIQRLSSGLRINSAKDDAAGLAISERFTTQIRGMNQAARNANDGISLAQTAEGALGEIGNNLQRIRELAVQSVNATNSASDRAALNAEVSQLKAEIGRVATQTQFNGTNLLDGSFTAQAFQVGANQGQTITIDAVVNAQTGQLGTWSMNTEAVEGSDAVATTSAASGAFTDAVSDAEDQSFAFLVDGATVFSATQEDGTPVTVDAAALDSAIATWAAASDGAYSVTGTVADGDLAISKADGTDIAIALQSDFGDAAGAFAGAGFIGSHTGGTEAVAPVEAEAVAMTGFEAENILTAAAAERMILAMDGALTAVSDSRAELGAIQNRFGSVVANLQTTSENLSASRSRIMDTDFAAETAELSRTQILQQAGTAMLAQANQATQGILSLLR